MSQSQQLQQKYSQSIVMTPQLRQAIKILELSQQDLTALVAIELIENPLLSLDEGDIEGHDAVHEHEPDPLEIDFQEQWTVQDNPYSAHSDPWENVSTSPISLRDHLMSQVAVDFKDPLERMIANCLVDTLDDSGYLTKNYANLALKLGCTKDQVDAVLNKCQKMDPAGVFSHNLTQCLQLQLEDRDLLDEKTHKVLQHIELIQLGETARLMKVCNLSLTELQQIMSHIRSCDPKPGLQFASIETTEITPDVILSGDPEQGWTVKLNSKHRFSLQIDESLFNALRSNKDSKKYISERHATAQGLIKAIEQRQNTLLHVTQALIVKQQDFFTKGVQYLKPMTLQDIALETGLHESTISRIANSKYIQTDRGTFELRFFFSSSLRNIMQQEDMSSHAVRHKIQELIANENREKPLSDDQLVKELGQQGIVVARRTITKYREALKISSSYQRKRRYAQEI